MSKLINGNLAETWLADRGIVLEESFIFSLRQYSIKYQKLHKIRLLDDVYQMIGTCKSHISYWEKHPYSTQTKFF